MHIPALLGGLCLYGGGQALTQAVLAGDIATFGAVYRFCHDTVQPPLPETARILAEYMKWMPEACRSQAMRLCSVLIKE